jgi:excisionase family DNA binding protein
MERLTVNEAADRLRISQGAVRKRIQRGTIPYVKRMDGSVYVFLDTDTVDVGRKSGSESDDQLTLHYLDKVYNSWQTVSSGWRRLSFAMVLTSLLLLILSGGGASAEQKLTLSGIGLKLPFVVFLIAGAVGIVFLMILLTTADAEQSSLEGEILRLYEEIGLDDSTLEKAWSSSEPGPFGTGDLVLAFAKSFTGGFKSWIGYGVYIELPMAAQVAVGFKVSELLQKLGFGWVWILFLVLPIITVVVFLGP